MLRSELAATTLALIVGACTALPSPAEAEQSSSQSASKPVSDVGNGKPTESQKREDHKVTAKAPQKVRETDRLMRWLDKSAL